MRIVPETAIRAAIGPAEALASAESAFSALARGQVELPPPMALEVPAVAGEVHVKSAYLKGAPIFAVKIATGFYRNAERGLATGSGLVVVFDAETGFPSLLLDDRGYLTDLRTAAAGVLAARLLAAESIASVAVLGSGVQARHQVEALAQVRRWERTRVWSRSPERLRSYCSELAGQYGIPFTPAGSPDEAVRGADLLITTTPSRLPLFQADSLAPHATVIAVGSDGPEKRELPTGAMLRADKIVVDKMSQCLRLGELHHPVHEGVLQVSDVHAELGDVLIGNASGREGNELIICDLTGVGAQDAAIAQAAWEKLGTVG